MKIPRHQPSQHALWFKVNTVAHMRLIRPISPYRLQTYNPAGLFDVIGTARFIKACKVRVSPDDLEDDR